MTSSNELFVEPSSNVVSTLNPAKKPEYRNRNTRPLEIDAATGIDC